MGVRLDDGYVLFGSSGRWLAWAVGIPPARSPPAGHLAAPLLFECPEQVSGKGRLAQWDHRHKAGQMFARSGGVAWGTYSDEHIAK